MEKYKPLPWAAVYYAIKGRCERKSQSSYKDYGAKGIKCLITKDEVKYLWFRDNAMKLKKPSIDRIDRKGHYEILNCRFIEMSENVRRVNGDKTECLNGHPLSGDNLYKHPRIKRRICRTCIKESHRRYNEKKKGVNL